jgi:alpha-tubulin suppressor-like RCC1 family protein
MGMRAGRDRIAERGGARPGESRSGGILRARRLLPALLAALLLAGALVAGTASARPAGAVSAAAETNKPPKVTKQPLSQTVEEGQSVSFTSTASGVPAPTVQWERSTNAGVSWSPIEGATSETFTIASASTSESANQFRATFKNVVGEATSKAATLTVRKAPAITQQPVSTTVEEGQNAVFEATASGFPAPTVQWQTSANGVTWTNVAGATSNQLTIANAKTSSSGHQYRAVFKNVAGTTTSESATLTVQKLPAVTKQPTSITVNEGQNATFEATASGFPAPAVQWEISTDGGGTWNPVEGATSNQLTVPNTTTSEDGHQYRAVFTNTAGTATSQTATLTVHAPPVITQQPASAILMVGENVTFQATASGFPAPTEQWELSVNGGSTWTKVEGATSTQLTVENAQASESGHKYRAVFTNTAATATSEAATLTVATNRYSAVGWGQNLYGQLGDGSNRPSKVPVAVSALKFVTEVAAGGHHSLALLADGTVKSWGLDELGQLGNGSAPGSNFPVAVEGLTGVKAIAAGASHSLALLASGKVMAWGANESGQLGTGTTKDSEVPLEVKGLTSVKAISAGGNFSLALLNNGTVMSWGGNESGQLGTGNTKRSEIPIVVKGLTGVKAISAGADFSLALLDKETVEGWGSDEFGQLANSSLELTGSNVPVPVGSLTGVTSIAAGATHGLALLSNGTVMAWGEDNYGELGNGTFKAIQETPVAVTGLSGAAAISAGTQDSAALLGSGALMTWGINRSGQLGNGAGGSPSAVPVSVVGLRAVASVSAGGVHMLAFGEPIPVVTGVSPSIGPAAGGSTVEIAGADLGAATAVKFGTIAATSFTVNSDSSITATAPPGSGTVDVRVETPTGVSPPVAADRYTYQPAPTVTKLSVKTGPAAGGTSVTITGTGLTGATSVSFGETAATSYTVNSSTSIVATSPAAIAGAVDVRVTTIGGTSAVSTKDLFSYTPSVDEVTPNSGPVAGGTAVTVKGSGFAPGSSSSFTFGKRKASSVNCASTSSCTMVSPPGIAGTVDVLANVNQKKSPINKPGDEFTFS